MNPNEALIDLYESNKAALGRAITSAGGMKDLTDLDPYRAVLISLASNNIAITATHTKQAQEK